MWSGCDNFSWLQNKVVHYNRLKQQISHLVANPTRSLIRQKKSRKQMQVYIQPWCIVDYAKSEFGPYTCVSGPVSVG